MAKKSKTQRAKASAARAQRKQAREELENESPASENVTEAVEEKPKRSLFKKDTDSKETAEKSAAKAVSKDKKDAKPKKKRFQFFPCDLTPLSGLQIPQADIHDADPF